MSTLATVNLIFILLVIAFTAGSTIAVNRMYPGRDWVTKLEMIFNKKYWIGFSLMVILYSVVRIIMINS